MFLDVNGEFDDKCQASRTSMKHIKRIWILAWHWVFKIGQPEAVKDSQFFKDFI